MAYNWNTDSTIVSLQYSSDGQDWIDDASSPISSTSNVSAISIGSSSSFLTKYARIKVTTNSTVTKTTKYRIGVASADLTFPE